MAKHVLMAMTNPVEGQEAEFNDWYTNRHIHDVMGAPGMVAAQRFVLADLQRYPGPYPFKYMALYDIEADDIGPTIDYLNRHVGTETIVESSAMADAPAVRGIYLKPITQRLSKPLPASGAQPDVKNLLVAMTNAVERRDDDYNHWYNDQHLPDVVNAPGIVAAQRFELDAQQRYAGPYDFRYVAIYEIETESVQGIIDYIGQAAGTPAMPMTDALAAEPRVRGAYFRPITPRVLKA